MKRFVVSAVCAAALLAGCGKSEDAPRPPVDPADKAEPKPVPPPEKCGTIVVKVTLKGEPPKPQEINVTDAECHGAQIKGHIRDLRVVVGSAGELANVIGWLDTGVDPGWRWPIPSDPYVLDQANCLFVPRAGTMRAGQPLELRNSDEAVHFIHAKPKLNTPFNMSLAPGNRILLKAEGKSRTFTVQEEPFPVSCEPHPWMFALVGVFRHPFHGVTGAEGTLRMTGVPEGEYTLKLKHEKYGVQSLTVKVEAGRETSAQAAFGE